MKSQAPKQAKPVRQNSSSPANTSRQAQDASGFVDNRQHALAQGKLIESINGSAQVMQQKAFGDSINNSSRMVAQRQAHDAMFGAVAQLEAEAALQPNRTGLPDNLKAGIESLSGISMDHVRVHYNSPQPAQLNAHAYAQGSEIHVAPGQEQHLPHEAWHVVQQAQGRVQATTQMKGGVAVNDDMGLEREADVMGAKAMALTRKPDMPKVNQRGMGALQLKSDHVIQRIQDFDFSYNDSEADEGDEHEAQKGFSFGLWPSKGQLTGETESKYEAKLAQGTPRYDYYYGIVPDEDARAQYGPVKKVKRSLKERGDSLSYGGLYHPYQKKAMIQFARAQPPIQRALKNITLRSGGGPYPFDYTLGANNNINFSANTAAGNYDPVDHASLVDLETGCAVPGSGVTKNGTIVDIAPNGTRAQHFSIADRINPAAAAKRPGKWTWHHLDAQYQMVLVDSNVHNPGYGGFFHYGGMAFWV